MALLNPYTLQFNDAVLEQGFSHIYHTNLRYLDLFFGCFSIVTSVQAICHAWHLSLLLLCATAISLIPRVAIPVVSLLVPTHLYSKARPWFLRVHRTIRMLPYLTIVPLALREGLVPCTFARLHLVDALYVPLLQMFHQPMFTDYVWLHTLSCITVSGTAMLPQGACNTLLDAATNNLAEQAECKSISRTFSTTFAVLELVVTAGSTPPLPFLQEAPASHHKSARLVPYRGLLVVLTALQISLGICVVACMQWRLRVQYLTARLAAGNISLALTINMPRIHAPAARTVEQEMAALCAFWFPPGFPIRLWLMPAGLCLAAWPLLCSWH